MKFCCIFFFHLIVPIVTNILHSETAVKITTSSSAEKTKNVFIPQGVVMKYKTAALLIIAGILLTFFFVTNTNSQQALKKTYTVKLYSDGKIVGTWTAREFGSVDGQTLTFTIGSDFQPRKVRISGTYSVEESE